MVTLRYGDFRLSVFRPVDLVSAGFQMGLDNGPEWFHLSFAHTHSFAKSVIIPFPVSMYSTDGSPKSQTLPNKHLLVCVMMDSYAIHRFHLCFCENEEALIPGWPLGLDVQEHKTLCPKFPV